MREFQSTNDTFKHSNNDLLDFKNIWRKKLDILVENNIHKLFIILYRNVEKNN